MGIGYICGSHFIIFVGVMSFEVRIDDRGRITLPKEVRERLNLKSGDRLLIKIRGDSIILVRAEDPFKIIESILGDLTFKRELRFEAEKQALQEIKNRHSG